MPAPTTTTTTPPPPAPPDDLLHLQPRRAPTTAAATADLIVRNERIVRDPGSSLEQIARAGLDLQVAYRALGVHPEWDQPVLAAVPGDLKWAVQINAAARREFRSMHTVLAENMPAWRIVEPPPAEDLLRWYQEAEAEFGVPWSVLAAVNLVETGMGRIRGTSIAGAQGPMQFMPSTWAAYGEGDINDPQDAIRGAARYLAANGGGADLDNALWHYNHSDHYVRGVRMYASLIAEHPRAFLTYYHWGVWYLTASGDLYLPVGYELLESIPVVDYLNR